MSKLHVLENYIEIKGLIDIELQSNNTVTMSSLTDSVTLDEADLDKLVNELTVMQRKIQSSKVPPNETCAQAHRRVSIEVGDIHD